MIHGLLNLDKPKGWTSHDAVAKVRRLIDQQRVGHAGTLDPNATGVLLLCLGNATKLSRYFMFLEKEYHAFFRFGVATDTQDADGRVIETRETDGLTEEKLRETIARYRGAILQTPPMVSAVKVGGKRLYRLARRGKTVERQARPIEIRSFDLLRFEPPVAEVHLVCSKGTYVRTLAADIGEDLGCGAYLERLTRVRIGPYRVEDAMGMEALEESAREGGGRFYVPLEDAIRSLPVGTLRATPGRWAGFALPRSLEALDPIEPIPAEGQFLRIADRSGRSLGVVEVEKERGKLRKVFVLGGS
ncbi:MAG: tRNA pseudouridine(55) synthase TruB [Candidatus Eisenbacteria bacterium]|nr:tRNA pseudouridine(55) synthase TruB [Candidatus Eisenbacteria bacterium]